MGSRRDGFSIITYVIQVSVLKFEFPSQTGSVSCSDLLIRSIEIEKERSVLPKLTREIVYEKVLQNTRA